jgi:hypothetical protein
MPFWNITSYSQLNILIALICETELQRHTKFLGFHQHFTELLTRLRGKPGSRGTQYEKHWSILL